MEAGKVKQVLHFEAKEAVEADRANLPLILLLAGMVHFLPACQSRSDLSGWFVDPGAPGAEQVAGKRVDNFLTRLEIIVELAMQFTEPGKILVVNM